MAKKEEKAVKEKNKENKIKKHFFKDFKAELKKVIWPTPKQLTNNTMAVVVIVVIVGVIVFALDAIFEAGQKHLIAPAQSYIVEKFGEEEKAEENEAEHEHEDEAENTTSENESTTENAEENSENSTESNQ